MQDKTLYKFNKVTQKLEEWAHPFSSEDIKLLVIIEKLVVDEDTNSIYWANNEPLENLLLILKDLKTYIKIKALKTINRELKRR